MSEMHEDAAAYALASLDAADVVRFEAHLAACVYCQQEVVTFGDTAAELSVLTQATPPPQLRANVLEAVRDLPQLPAEGVGDVQSNWSATRVHRTSAGTGAHPTQPRRALPGSEVPDELDPPRLDEVELRRQRRRNRTLSGLVAALLALTVGLGGVVYTLVQQRQAQRAELAQRFSEEQVVRAPDARLATVKLKNGGVCTFVVSDKQNRALFLGTNMPDPGPERQYQLWTGTGTVNDPSPVLDNPVPNKRPWRQSFRGNVAAADLVAISIERQGSTPAAPTDLVAVAKIRS